MSIIPKFFRPQVSVSSTATEQTGETVSGATGAHVAPVANAALTALALGTLGGSPVRASINRGLTSAYGSSGSALSAAEVLDVTAAGAGGSSTGAIDGTGRLRYVALWADHPTEVTLVVKLDGQTVNLATSAGGLCAIQTGSTDDPSVGTGREWEVCGQYLTRFDSAELEPTAADRRYGMVLDLGAGLGFAEDLLIRVTNSGAGDRKAHLSALFTLDAA